MKTNLAISIIGAIQGIILSVFFFSKSKKKLAILLLGLFIFIFSIGLLENWVATLNTGTMTRILGMFIANSNYLYGPLLYLFVVYLTTGKTKFNSIHHLHFFPFILFVGINILLLITGYEVNNDWKVIIELGQFEILMIQLLVYNFKTIKLLDLHYINILATYSNIEKRDLRWLRLIILIITCIYIFSFILSHLAIFGVKSIDNFFVVIQVSITMIIYGMSYGVLLRPGLFPLTFASIAPITEEEIKETGYETEEDQPLAVKYKRSGLKLEEAREHLQDLQILMERTRCYKNPDLNILGLAELLGISKNHLTQILNEQMKMNFFEFINRYRVEEAKKLLLDTAYTHLSLQGIAAEAGYKSKTTFFANFRKIAGCTPLEWIKSNQPENKYTE